MNNRGCVDTWRKQIQEKMSSKEERTVIEFIAMNYQLISVLVTFDQNVEAHRHYSALVSVQ